MSSKKKNTKQTQIGLHTCKNVISLNKAGFSGRFKVPSRNGTGIESTQLSLNLMSKKV